MSVYWGIPEITSDILLLALVNQNNSLRTLFEKHDITPAKILHMVEQSRFPEEELEETPMSKVSQAFSPALTPLQPFWKKIQPYVEMFFDPETAILDAPKREANLKDCLSNITDFTPEVTEVFDIASDHMLERFKNCSLQVEILLVTLFEEDCTARTILQSFFPTELEWLEFRFKFFKVLYNREVMIRTYMEEDGVDYYLICLFRRVLSDKKMYQVRKNTKGITDLVRIYRRRLLDLVLSPGANYKQLHHDIEADTYFHPYAQSFENFQQWVLSEIVETKLEFELETETKLEDQPNLFLSSDTDQKVDELIEALTPYFEELEQAPEEVFNLFSQQLPTTRVDSNEYSTRSLVLKNLKEEVSRELQENFFPE
jgi:hypothetical protein